MLWWSGQTLSTGLRLSVVAGLAHVRASRLHPRAGQDRLSE